MLWWTDILGSVIRWAMTAAGMYLVQHHVITDAQSETLTVHIVSLSLAAAPAIAALVWSLWQKAVARTALSTTVEALEESLKANHRMNV